MVVMDLRDLLTDVSIFLRVTLAQETLSEQAQTCRQQLISKMALRHVTPPPQAYIDMNGGCMNNQKLQREISDCYEEFDSSREKRNISNGYENNLYNNMTSAQEENIYANNDHDTERYVNVKNCEDNFYIEPSSAIANTPVAIGMSLSQQTSPSGSERNSVISFKKDSPDKNSDSSSIASSSTRCDELPEVIAMSASALRYAAAKCGVLGRREKFFFVEHTKPYWVAAVNQTLYLFCTDKDPKPALQLDIAGYKARAVVGSGNTKTEFKFELVCPGKKTHQFSAEKQSEMEVWISALNAIAVDTCARQLPSLPDITDGRLTLSEGEYLLPSSVPRCIPSATLTMQLEAHFKDRRFSDQSGASERFTRRLMKEDRELPLLPHEQPTYDHPDPAAKPVEPRENYECVREELYHSISEPRSQKTLDTPRSLPLLPYEFEMYDCPEPTIRPVHAQPPVQEEFYSNIENEFGNESQEPKQIEKGTVKTPEILYKNIEDINNKNIVNNNTKPGVMNNSITIVNKNTKNSVEDENYYNIVAYPEAEREQESIYDVISEQRLMKTPMASPYRIKLPTTSKVEELKLKFGDKIKAPPVSNVATIFNKPFGKPNLTVVKPPILNKSCQ